MSDSKRIVPIALAAILGGCASSLSGVGGSERYACKAEDWTGGQYIVRGFGGAADVVVNLPQLWRAVETCGIFAIRDYDRDPRRQALLFDCVD